MNLGGEKEIATAPRPCLGLSSLQHTAETKIESEIGIESAGASLKVLIVENSREKVTSSTTAVNNASTQPSQSTACSVPNSKSTTAIGAVKRTHNGVPRKNADRIGATNGQKVMKAKKQKMTNEEKPKPQSSTENSQNFAASNANVDAKSGNGTVATQQNGDKPSANKKEWKLANLDINRRLLGDGKFAECPFSKRC